MPGYNLYSKENPGKGMPGYNLYSKENPGEGTPGYNYTYYKKKLGIADY